MALSGRGNVHLGSARTDGLDGIHNHTEVFLILGEVELFAVLGVRLHHKCVALVRQRLPYFLGDKRHERVQELEYLNKDIQKHSLGALLCRFIIAVQARLCQLNVPVAVIIPDEIVDLSCRNAQLKAVHIIADLFDDAVELGEDPLILGLERLGQMIILNGEVHHDKARCVPYLVAEVAHCLALFNVEAHVVAGAVAGYKVKAQRVRAVLFGHLQRINAVAEALGHFSALTVAHKAVDEHGVERLFFHLLHAGEYHSRDPEEDDIIARYHNRGRIPVVKLGGLVRPAHGRERPER